MTKTVRKWEEKKNCDKRYLSFVRHESKGCQLSNFGLRTNTQIMFFWGKGVRCLQTMWLFMAGLSPCLERSVWAAQAVPLDVHLCSTGNIIPSSIGQRKCLHQEVLRMKYLKYNSYRHVQCTNLNYTTSLCYLSLFNTCLHHRMLYGLMLVHSIRFVLFDNWT